MDYDLENTDPGRPSGSLHPSRWPTSRPEDATVAVVVARLDDLRNEFQSVRAEIRASAANVVGRGEWVQRNQHVDGKFDAQGREISQLRADLAARRMPWPAVVGAVTGSGSVLFFLIQNLAK